MLCKLTVSMVYGLPSENRSTEMALNYDFVIKEFGFSYTLEKVFSILYIKF
jgi:hypothetical protein